jgi:hypothetical protein
MGLAGPGTKNDCAGEDQHKFTQPYPTFLPPASAEVKKLWMYTSTPTYSFMALCLVS